MDSSTTLLTSHRNPSPARKWMRATVWALAAISLAGVFMLYTQPEFMVLMADQIWACF